jgi:hypothetical protein
MDGVTATDSRLLALCICIALAIGSAVGTQARGAEPGWAEPPAEEMHASWLESVYGRRYTRNILRGVTRRDVFTFNDEHTTDFGPAYADIWTLPENFLSCKPPTGRPFSYALCFYSGPDAPTGYRSSDNPSLPCTLSPNGVVANCTCYEITTDQFSPKVPYFVDINAIANLEIYRETVEACGQDGSKCNGTDIDPPVCDAINANLLIPGAALISVFSPLLSSNYPPANNDRPACGPATYAGCMTAPCYRTGLQDAEGNDLVECKCPVYEGPYQLGQSRQLCDANATRPMTETRSHKRGGWRQRNVWSAAYNPFGGDINPPGDRCIPDLPPGSNGCPLYDPAKQYNVKPDSGLCTNVCAAYKASRTVLDPKQVGYTCDATLCTTLGIAQEDNSSFPPPQKAQAALLGAACNGIGSVAGMKDILKVEELAECSCCASQVCGCDSFEDNINAETEKAIAELNAAQLQTGVVPQCDINQTLCGAP